MTAFATGLILAVAVAATAYRLHALTPDGALAAISLGTLVYLAGGLAWSVLLIAFFASSSIISRLFHTQITDGYLEKHGPRDWVQVAANGLVPALASVLSLAHASALPSVIFAASIATATSDTWAGELGRLSRSAPVHILTLRPAIPGTSGGITAAGTVAGLLGAASIAVLAVPLLNLAPRASLLVACTGLAGCLLDSLLGATVQEVRHCPHCNLPTEQHVHRLCNTPTLRSRGIPHVTNDTVNAASCLFAATLAVLFFLTT